MSDTMPGFSEWKEFYQQSISREVVPSPGGLSDAVIVTTSVTTDNMLSRSNSSTTAGGHPNPKGCVSKPIRRRSRASRMTPTTLINADTSNFRALVQRFTGCSSARSSFETRRGPINLNFELTNEQQVLNATSMMASFGCNNYNQITGPQQEQPLQSQRQHQQMYQEHQSMFSFHNNESDIFLSAFSDPRPNNQTMENFVMENIPLHELAGDFSSYVIDLASSSRPVRTIVRL
ncbi:hypothetical protein F0562_029685 [Nyssa sinensis]|uniref:VQ domain-containing protein n=1 Tax=Nyssa sinensis TaxID=561372 RepID=A0A5J5B1Q5_9ASTE|nr:hypothetical protein F0562_029685 [Nyssa sinensis]